MTVAQLRKVGVNVPPDLTDDTEIAVHKIGDPWKPRKKTRDLENAAVLRPAEIFERYGIHATTVSQYCRHPDPRLRLPSYKIEGRSGRKGIRLIPHSDFLSWLERWRVHRSYDLERPIIVIEYSPEENCYWAKAPDLEACAARGADYEEALARIKPVIQERLKRIKRAQWLYGSEAKYPKWPPPA